MTQWRVDDLLGQLSGIDFMDDVALLTWLKHMLESCVREQREFPEAGTVAARIAKARQLTPNTGVPNNPSQHNTATWLICECLGALLSGETPVPGATSIYGITALAIDPWLVEQRRG